MPPASGASGRSVGLWYGSARAGRQAWDRLLGGRRGVRTRQAEEAAVSGREDHAVELAVADIARAGTADHGVEGDLHRPDAAIVGELGGHRLRTSAVDDSGQ